MLPEPPRLLTETAEWAPPLDVNHCCNWCASWKRMRSVYAKAQLAVSTGMSGRMVKVEEPTVPRDRPPKSDTLHPLMATIGFPPKTRSGHRKQGGASCATDTKNSFIICSSRIAPKRQLNGGIGSVDKGDAPLGHLTLCRLGHNCASAPR